MEAGRPSETATLAAMFRAAHPLLDSEPWILNDPMAGPLAGLPDTAALRAAVASFQDDLARSSSPLEAQTLAREVRAVVTVRARFAEDMLDEAVERGISQFVILGAGFDSFAYRRPDLAGRLRVFELDHPATQERKRARLAGMGIPLPHHLSFVPIDFETQPILETLEQHGFRKEGRAFFSWLGVTWYLTEAAIGNTLRQVASARPGSEIVLDYVLPESLIPQDRRQYSRLDHSIADDRGEPPRTCFDPLMLLQQLRMLGFADARDVNPEALNARYLANRSDGLLFPSRIHLMTARTGDTWAA